MKIAAVIALTLLLAAGTHKGMIQAGPPAPLPAPAAPKVGPIPCPPACPVDNDDKHKKA